MIDKEMADAFVRAAERRGLTVKQVYESCVIDPSGKCTRWSHDHSDDAEEET